MTLNPQAKAYLDRVAATNPPRLVDIGVAARYLGYAESDLAGAIDTTVQISHRFISSNSADLPIRIYRPEITSSKAALHNGFIYFHGGGWVFGRIDNYDAQMSYLAKATNSVVISVNYQKAPEHKFPTPHQDCFETLQWVESHAEELGIDPTKIGIGGDSAGGNLASGVALRARDEGGPAIAYQLLLYPAVDIDFETESYKKYAQDYGLTREEMIWFWDQYLHPEDHHNPYALPARASNFAGLPPTILITAEYDVLRDDGFAYADKLGKAGNNLHFKNYDSDIHGFFSLGKYIDSAFEVRQHLADTINKILAGN